MSQNDRNVDNVGSEGGHGPTPDGSDGVDALVPVRSRARQVRSGVTVVLVLALSGLMFSASARLGQEKGGRHPENLTDLVQSEEDRVESMVDKVVGLESEIAVLAEDLGSTDVASPEDVVRTGIVMGSVPVTGPAISVTLDDAPATQLRQGASVDDLVVHQQDLQNVINALWAGGAEAMTLQGQRVTPTTAFRCAGNILLLHGRVFSPPYTVSAIGDPAALHASLDRSPALNLYQDYVDAYGLGWKVEKSPSMEIPAFEGTTDLKFASVLEGVEDGA